MSFAFRFRFVAPGLNLDSDEKEIPLAFCGGGEVRLRATHNGDELRGATDLCLLGTGYPSSTAAQSAAERLRNAIRKSALDLGIGFDTGKDRTTSDFSEDVKEAVKATTGASLIPDIHGVHVYEESGPVICMNLAVSVQALHPVAVLLTAWQRHHEANLHLAPKEVLALEVYAGSCREPTSRSRLIALATTVEVLSTRRERSAEALSLLDSFTERLVEIPAAERSSLSRGLEELRCFGIASACRRYVKDALGKGAADEFDRIYSIRSRLLHVGDCPESDISIEADNLSRIVVPLLERLGLPNPSANS